MPGAEHHVVTDQALRRARTPRDLELLGIHPTAFYDGSSSRCAGFPVRVPDTGRAAA